ncbi:hypothetical protein [Ideonella dechloratans]|uniref:hypothetical protein n=1 Tax=Ideonella dechloratans TaxID=36863 RepID=UPI0035ADABB7
MQLSDLLPWFNPGLAVASALYTWVATRDKDNSQHIRAVEEAMTKRLAEHAAQLAEHNLRLEHVQTVQAHMPTHRDVADLQAELAALRSQQAATGEDVKVIRNAVDSLRDYLMSQKD